MDKINGYLATKTFWTIISIIIAAITAIFSFTFSQIDRVDQRSELNRENFSSVQSQLSSMHTDLIWIKLNLSEHKEESKK